MQKNTFSRYTLVRHEGNTFEEIDLDDVAQNGILNDEGLARSTAQMLTAEAKAQMAQEAKATVRIVAVRTLESISRNTQAGELTLNDVRWLAGEVVDRCDFFCAAPDWAQNLIDSVPDRRNFDPKFMGRVLSAIRCVLSVDRQMERQMARHEAMEA